MADHEVHVAYAMPGDPDSMLGWGPEYGSITPAIPGATRFAVTAGDQLRFNVEPGGPLGSGGPDLDIQIEGRADPVVLAWNDGESRYQANVSGLHAWMTERLGICVGVDGLPTGAAQPQPEPATEWNPPNDAAIDEAVARGPFSYDLWKYWTGGNVGGAGPQEKSHHSAFVQLMAFVAGDQSVEDEVLNQWDRFANANMPAGQGGGYATQYEAVWMAYALVGKNTPKLWNLLSEPQRKAMELTVKACAGGAAFAFSKSNPYRTSDQDVRTIMNMMISTGAYNFSGPPIWAIVLGSAYLGEGKLQSWFEGYSRGDFIDAIDQDPAVKALLPDVREVWSKTWTADNLPDGSSPIGESGPDGAMVAEALHGFRDIRLQLPAQVSSIKAHVIDQCERAFPHEVGPGMPAYPSSDPRNPDGEQWGVFEDGTNDGRRNRYVGRILDMGLAAEQPNAGKLGMAHEFFTGDAGGHRSSVHYVKHGLMSFVCGMIALAYSGHLDAKDPAVNEALTRADIGMKDFAWKTGVRWPGYEGKLSTGYDDWSKNGRPKSPNETLKVGNEDWLAYDIPSLVSLWFDVFRPWWKQA